MKKVKFLKNKSVFLQDCGIYSNQIIVAIECEKQDILNWLTKQERIKKEAIDWIKGENEAFEIFNEMNALVAHNDGKLMLLLKKVEDDWDYLETLLHELNHVVWYIARDRRFRDEMEAQAYLQEYLFHSIRRKLTMIEKI